MAGSAAKALFIWHRIVMIFVLSDELHAPVLVSVAQIQQSNLLLLSSDKVVAGHGLH